MPNKLSNNASDLSQIIAKHLEIYFNRHEDGIIPPGLYERIINEVERSMISETLKYTDGNQFKTAKILNISRNTLRKKIKKLAIGAEDNN